MKKNKKSGITLIALVVTIIVLLILAGISISMLSGNNSILKNAVDAKRKTEIAQKKERIGLAVNSAILDGLGNLNYDNLIKALNNEFGQDGYEISQVTDDEWIITIDGISYTISNVGKVAEYDGDLLMATNRGNSENIGNTGTKSSINLNLASSLNIENINLEIDLPAKKTQQELSSYIPIYTPEQFMKIASGENNYEIKDLEGNTIGKYTMSPNKAYALINDLNFGNVTNMKPIKGFSGMLEGNGCTIKGLYIDTTSDETYTSIIDGTTNKSNPAGLFECMNGGRIQNLAVTNSEFKSKESVGAIVGQWNGASIYNCYVKECSLIGKRSSGGLIGLVNGGGYIGNCKVINAYNREKCDFGGICGASYGSSGTIRIENCNVVCNSVDSAIYSSGILHCCFNTPSIYNCHVQGITVNQSGILGTLLNASSDNPVVIEKCTVKGTNIGNTNTYSNYNYSTASGIFDCSFSKKVTITNCKVENINVNYSFRDFATIARYMDNSEQTVITQCDVKNVTINKNIEYLGGITSDSRQGNTVITTCTVDGIEAKKNIKTSGGIIRYISGKSFTIQNCKVNNVKINIDDSRDRNGGILAYESVSGNENVIGGCYVNEYNITGSEYSFSGIAEILTSKTTVSNCCFTNSTVVSTQIDSWDKYAGVVGWATNRVAINNCKVENVSFDTKSGTATTGILGCAYNSSLNNNNVENITIKNYNEIGNSAHFAGITSFSSGSTIRGCNATNITIDVKKGTVGGIISHNDSSAVEGCKVSNSVIKNENGYTGGICGYGYATGCRVENTQIDASNCIGVGGIIGHSKFNANDITTNCSLDTSTVKGKSYVGGICGAAGRTITRCTATNSIITGSENAVGGIQGFGGEVDKDPTSALITIEGCDVINSQLRGKSHVDYIQGRNSYTKGKENNESTDKINNCKHTNTVKTIAK